MQASEGGGKSFRSFAREDLDISNLVAFSHHVEPFESMSYVVEPEKVALETDQFTFDSGRG